MGFENSLATRTRGITASAIREILKTAARPDMSSLAGGLPALESFPAGIMPELLAQVLARYGPAALQYDPTEGFAPLRPILARYLTAQGLACRPEEILMASGSQGVLDGLGKVLLDPGDAVAVEAPTYLGALQAFSAYQPRYLRLETDEEGLIPESLETTILAERPKFIYLVPTFQNPTGRTIPLARRRRIAEIIVRLGALVVEDDPYSALRYDGAVEPTIKSLAPENVVYVGTFSKVLAPGLRVGYCLAPEPIRRYLVLVKQGVDLHTGTLSQALAAEYLSGGHLARHLPSIIELYRPRRDALRNALERYFPADFGFSLPQGGMFIWVTGPQGFDMDPVYERCLERKVAFVPGRYFFSTPGEGRETMRLNFTAADESTLDRCARIMAEVIEEMP